MLHDGLFVNEIVSFLAMTVLDFFYDAQTGLLTELALTINYTRKYLKTLFVAKKIRYCLAGHIKYTRKQGQTTPKQPPSVLPLQFSYAFGSSVFFILQFCFLYHILLGP